MACASVLLAGVSHVPALAAEEVVAADTIADADAAPAGDSQEIFVTAQKIEQRAVDVPITISAISGAQMRELGVSDLDELSNYVPGLNIQEQSANNPGIVIRGITSDSGSSQQAARVTLYYNGVDISRSRGAYQDVYDIERIEVVKGPQATLFGTASTIGAISIISARPRPGFSGELTAGLGNLDQRLLSGHLNAGNDVVAGRIAFAWKKRDGYVENLDPVQDDLNGQDQLGVRGSLRFTPSPDVTADLILTYDRQRNPGTAFITNRVPPASQTGVFGPAWLGGSPLSKEVLGLSKLGLHRDVYDANFTLAWDFADDWTLTTVNGYREFDSLEVFDADGTRAWFLEFAEDAKGHQINHETRFAYDNGESFRTSFGWNFFHEKNSQTVPFSSDQRVFAACAARPGPLCIAPDGSVPAAAVGAPIPYRSIYSNRGENDSYSVFADGTWTPTPALELTAGARVLIEKRRSGYVSDVPNALNGRPLIANQVSTRGELYEVEDSFSALLPRFNILYRLSDRVNAYATISKGRRSPTVQIAARSTAAGPVPAITNIPEENVWNYEAGLKGSAGIASGSIGVFYQKYDNFQVNRTLDNGTTVTESAGTASNLGVEAELSLRPTSWLRLFANGAWIDGGIDDKAANGVYAGDRFRLQPKVQASGGFTIDAPLGGDLRVFATPSVTYRSRIYFEVPNTPEISQEAVTLVNVRAGISFADRYELAAFARNLLDEDYLLDAGNTGRAFGFPTFIPAEPRLYGLQLTARF
ncbi:TonB-dependent receptor [Sphingomonas deserti]|uniref:TonB-dependent receptor n=1 Tax=Allosphingosinicella deserti TaxID=2116704 RepID=A0A2P7QME6_9SPHN|nr:TonB-dependent receptor [Sphingomonas deserti]